MLSSRTPAFGGNIHAERAFRKAERISAASYIITRHLSQEEPIRQEIRIATNGLVKDILETRSDLRAPGEPPSLFRLYGRARHVVSLIQVLSVSGYVSKENADLVCQAVEELVQFIDSARHTPLAEYAPLSKEDLMIDGFSRKGIRTNQPASSLPDSDKKKGALPDDTALPISPVLLVDKSKVALMVGGGHGGRKEAILDVLQGGRELGIKDVASYIVGCSEKTVQRELAALVTSGLVKRLGDKRWSRYALS